VECGDPGDGVVGRVAAGAALAEDWVVFEASDGVFGDGSAFTEPAVVVVFDDAPVWFWSPAWRSDALAAVVAAVA
jgi:hypothetical protein